VIAAAAGSKPVSGSSSVRSTWARTPYSDAYLYTCSDLVPATYYIEMDPGVANANDSRMPRDLESADVVILRRSGRTGRSQRLRNFCSDASTKVLARDFCPRRHLLRLYQLYRKCTEVRARKIDFIPVGRSS